jgi:alpha-beta hydrolase superfamily lysophospholipase
MAPEQLMKTETIRSQDGTALHMRVWGPGTTAALLVHGLGEHSGRYEHVGAALAAKGFRVAAVDLRGHGLSGGKRGHVDAWSNYVDDVNAATAWLGDSVCVFGHSMGGLVVADAAEGPGGARIRRVALSNPLLALRVIPPPLKVKVARLLSRVLPKLALGNEVKPAHISRDPEVVRRYEADPLVFGTITPRWATEMEHAQVRVFNNTAAFKAPLLMMVSEGDLIVDPAGGRRLCAAVSPPGRLLDYGPLFHELVNEPEQDRVIKDLVAFFAEELAQ